MQPSALHHSGSAAITMIDEAALGTLLTDTTELALLDAREEGAFAQGHLFWAVPCPLSEALWRAPLLLPRADVRIVVADGGAGEAEELANVLVERGYTNIARLTAPARSTPGCGPFFSGVNVPSKAFGEWVEHEYQTESIDPQTLKRWQDDGTNLAVLDARTFEEFRRMAIPGGISTPGGELVYRIGDLVSTPATTVVVNCAGRTRSILGAESLRRAGIPNRVVALRNGTMGWELAGFACERGAARTYPAGAPLSSRLAYQRAHEFADASGVRRIDRATLVALEADRKRTLYVLDVRSPDEYRSGHLPGSRSAPGGQLVQATDKWIGVRGSRIVLLDDTGARAAMAGGWLRQMGYREVYVVEHALVGPLEPGPERPPEAPQVPEISVSSLRETLGIPGTVLLDCAKSTRYRAGHIEGAIWTIPSRRSDLAGTSAERLVVTAPDGWSARYATALVAKTAGAPVTALAGGTAAWVAAGGVLVATPREPPDERCIDVVLKPYDRASGVEAAMREYLEWEIGLHERIAREGTIHFSRTGPAW